MISLKAPYSLLEYIVEKQSKIEQDSGSKMIIENNTLIINGDKDQQAAAGRIISEIMANKSETVPPRYDLCLQMKTINGEKLDTDKLPKSFDKV